MLRPRRIGESAPEAASRGEAVHPCARHPSHLNERDTSLAFVSRAQLRDGDRIFRTYFIDARGDEALGSTWSYLEMTALGRQEEWEDSPDGYPQTKPYEWWIWHDQPGRTDPDRAGLASTRAGR